MVLMEERGDDAENVCPISGGIESAKPALVQFEELKQPMNTKVYYYIEDQQVPFSTEVPVPPSRITLADFKKCITRRNYKYYCKVVDPALNAEVKTDIRDEHEVLQPNATNGRFELFLLAESSGCTSSAASTVPIQQLQPKDHGVRRSMMATKRTSVPPHYTAYGAAKKHSEPLFDFEDSSCSPEDTTNMRLFGESNFAASSLLSDNEANSQYTTTDFTSVSQQQHYPHGKRMGGNKRYDANNKPCWTRERRKRHRKSQSALSSTFDDTEVSMALDLVTVTFNMDTRRPFGMSVVVKDTRYFSGILVHSVAPNSLVALDGRIKPGFILLEVNDIPLDDYASAEAVQLLTSAVRRATETRGQLKLTCARGEEHEPVRGLFHPLLTEPVRPIDPTAWVQHTNAARGLDYATEERTISIEHQPAQMAGQRQQLAATTKGHFLAAHPSATVPKTNPKAQVPMPATAVPAPQKQYSGGGTLRMIQNPDLTVNTASGHSSLECSVGAELKGRRGKRKKGGGIGAVLRRLMCIRISKGKGRRAAEKRNKKARRGDEATLD